MDSVQARDYLAAFDQPQSQRLYTQLCADLPTTPVTREALARITRRHSADIATLCLAQRLLDDPVNRGWGHAFARECAWLRQGPSAAMPRQNDAAYLVVFVPGWLYRSYPANGADFARQRALLDRWGIAQTLIETDENAPVEVNAGIVADALRQLGRDGRSLIVVSVSKAGAEVVEALGARLTPAESRPVKAWINVAGMLQGTPLVDGLLRGWQRWLVDMFTFVQGRGYDGIASMGSARRRPAFSRLRIPEHIVVINYLGLPLSGHFEAELGSYLELRAQGPNDGRVLLVEAMWPGATTLIEPGLDHFFRDPHIDVKTAALARLVIQRLDCVQARGRCPDMIQAHDPNSTTVR